MLKNITLSADEKLIQKAREKARKQRTTLNAMFRRWLERYVSSANSFDLDELMKKLNYASPGRKFNRDELNER